MEGAILAVVGQVMAQGLSHFSSSRTCHFLLAPPNPCCFGSYPEALYSPFNQAKAASSSVNCCYTLSQPTQGSFILFCLLFP